MSNRKKICEIIDAVNTTNTEFSNEITTELDYYKNLNKTTTTKEEINKVKEFYDSKI